MTFSTFFKSFGHLRSIAVTSFANIPPTCTHPRAKQYPKRKKAQRKAARSNLSTVYRPPRSDWTKPKSGPSRPFRPLLSHIVLRACASNWTGPACLLPPVLPRRPSCSSPPALQKKYCVRSTVLQLAAHTARKLVELLPPSLCISSGPIASRSGTSHSLSTAFPNLSAAQLSSPSASFFPQPVTKPQVSRNQGSQGNLSGTRGRLLPSLALRYLSLWGCHVLYAVLFLCESVLTLPYHTNHVYA